MNDPLSYIIYLCILSRSIRRSHAELDVQPHEKNLMEHLFQNYDKRVRPSRSYQEPVNMTFGVAYVQLVQLDDKEMTLISNVWIRQIWHNHLLRWEPKKFNNVSVLTVSPHLVWLPDIVLYNNAKSGIGGGTMYQYKTKVIIKYDGTNKWFTPTIIRSGCDVSITYFPFDDQFCLLHFGSWTYHAQELDLNKDRDTADLKFYQKSTEFDLVSGEAEKKIFNYSCCPNITYPNIIFTIHLRRKPGFFLFNVIIPSMVITFFAILTFISPPFIGERISLAIESFLSLSFLCMMVADSIPVNSDVSPLITQFLVTCMTLISAALIFNMVSMNLASLHPVPEWLRKVAFVYIGPLVGFSGGMDLRKHDEENRESASNEINDFQSNFPGTHISTNILADYLKPRNTSSFAKNTIALRFRNMVKERLSNGKSDMYLNVCDYEGRLLEDGSTPVDMYKEEYKKVKQNMTDILRRSKNELNDKLNKEFWRCIAQTIDRICMISFSICFIFLSSAMLLRGYGHQLDIEREINDMN